MINLSFSYCTQSLLAFGGSLFLCAAAALATDAAQTSAQGNLAAGLAVTSSSTAYHHAGGNDLALLTDGAFSTELDKQLVGWEFSGQVLLGIDFPESRAVGSIILHSLRTANASTHADRVIAYASEDGTVFHEIGVLTPSPGSPASEGKVYHAQPYSLEGLALTARAIRIGVVTQGPFYANEIVIGSTAEGGKVAGGQPINDPESHLLTVSTELHAKRRVLEDFKTLSVELLERCEKSDLAPEEKKALIASLKPLREAVLSTPVEVSDPLRFKTIFPLNEAHRQIYQLFGTLAAARKAEALEVRTPNRWARFLPYVDGGGSRIDGDLRLQAIPGEARSAAFTVGNATAEPMTVRLAFQGGPDGGMSRHVTLHQTQWTDTKMRDVVASALTPLTREGDGWVMEIPAGMTQMVWISFAPEVGGKALGGNAKLMVSGGDLQREIPVRWNVFAGEWPKERSLNFGGWDYLRPVSDTNSASAGQATGKVSSNVDNDLILQIRDFLIGYGVDTPWAIQILDYGKYDDEGNMTTPPATEAFDQWVALWPNARRFGIFNHSKEDIDGKQMGTPAFENAVRQWAKFWGDHIEKLGLKQEFLLLVIDEPGYFDHQVPHATAWASAAREGTGRFKLWTDPCFKDPEKGATPEFWKAHDIVCPLLTMLREEGPDLVDYYVRKREAGHRLELYSCDGPSTQLDPYHYYRLQAWAAVDMGATAQTFWQLSDHAQKGLSWNEYINTYILYTPQFIGRDGVVTSRQMEAIREGMNDYEYFAILRKLTEQAKAAGVGGEWVAKADTLLKESPKRVLEGQTVAMMKWPAEAEREKADAVASELGETISQLSLALAKQPLQTR